MKKRHPKYNVEGVKKNSGNTSDGRPEGTSHTSRRVKAEDPAGCTGNHEVMRCGGDLLRGLMNSTIVNVVLRVLMVSSYCSSPKVTALEEGKPSQAMVSIHLISIHDIGVIIRLDVEDWSQHATQG